jgi:general secretion pathway protein J
LKDYKVKCFSFFHSHSEVRLQESDFRNGFTLLELMISLTIVGLILVVIFGSLRIGTRAWEKGEKDIEIHQRQRVVLDLIKRQIASTCVPESKVPDLRPLILKGDGTSMEFISRSPMVASNRAGMVYVKYLVSKEGGKVSLSFLEEPFAFLDEKRELGSLDTDRFYELIPAAESIRFEYLKDSSVEEALEWQQTWDPEKSKGLPRAVKVIFKENSVSKPICVIARIESEFVPG